MLRQRMSDSPVTANNRMAAMVRLGELAATPYPASRAALTHALELVADAMDATVCAILRPQPTTQTFDTVVPSVGLPHPAFDFLARDGFAAYTRNGAIARCLQSGLPQAFALYEYGTVLDAPPIFGIAASVHLDPDTVGVCIVLRRAAHKYAENDVLCLASAMASLGMLLRVGRLSEQLGNVQRRHDAVLDAAVDSFIQVDTNKRIIAFNKGAINLLGLNAEQVIGRKCSEVLAPRNERGELLCDTCPLDRAFRTGVAVTDVEATIQHTTDGYTMWTAGSYNAVYDADGQIQSGIMTFKDIDRIKAQDWEIQQQVVQMKSILSVIDAISTSLSLKVIYDRALEHMAKAIDFDLGIVHALDAESQTLVLLSSYQPERDATMQRFAENELYGSLREFDSCRALRENDPYMSITLPSQDLCPVLEGYPGLQSYLCVPIRTVSQIYGVLHLASRRMIAFNGSDFVLAHSFAKQIAIAAERAHLFDKMNEMTRIDAPTGLYNKSEFLRRLPEEIKRAERSGMPLSLLLLDIDDFKWVNATFGYSRADEVLRDLARLLRKHARSHDVAFRFGGEEMCLLLPQTSPEEAYEVAERIRRVVSEQIELDRPRSTFALPEGAKPMATLPNGKPLPDLYNVTISMGVAAYPTQARKPAGLFNAVNAAVLRAKERGKNQVCLFDPALDSERFQVNGG